MLFIICSTLPGNKQLFNNGKAILMYSGTLLSIIGLKVYKCILLFCFSQFDIVV